MKNYHLCFEPLTDEILKKNGFCDHPDFYATGCILHHFYLGDEHFIENEDLHIGREEKSQSYSLRYKHNSIWGINSVYELQWLFDFFHIGIQLQTTFNCPVDPQEEEKRK